MARIEHPSASVALFALLLGCSLACRKPERTPYVPPKPVEIRGVIKAHDGRVPSSLVLSLYPAEARPQPDGRFTLQTSSVNDKDAILAWDSDRTVGGSNVRFSLCRAAQPDACQGDDRLWVPGYGSKPGDLIDLGTVWVEDPPSLRKRVRTVLAPHCDRAFAGKTPNVPSKLRPVLLVKGYRTGGDWDFTPALRSASFPEVALLCAQESTRHVGDYGGDSMNPAMEHKWDVIAILPTGKRLSEEFREPPPERVRMHNGIREHPDPREGLCSKVKAWLKEQAHP